MMERHFLTVILCELLSSAYPLLMESKARSSSLFYRASYQKTASHFSGRTLAEGPTFSRTLDRLVDLGTEQHAEGRQPEPEKQSGNQRAPPFLPPFLTTFPQEINGSLHTRRKTLTNESRLQ